jgi:hypothetical protein
MASLHPWKLFFCPAGYFSLNLIVLAGVLLIDGEDFLILEEDVFAPVRGLPLEETLCSCLSDLLQSGRKEVTLRPLVGSQV